MYKTYFKKPTIQHRYLSVSINSKEAAEINYFNTVFKSAH